MKQQITSEQFNQLTLDQKRKIVQWAQSKTEKYNYPLLNIGQMIDLLLQRDVFDDTHDCVPLFEFRGGYVGVVWDGQKDGKEFVDSLWEAIKAVL